MARLDDSTTSDATPNTTTSAPIKDPTPPKTVDSTKKRKVEDSTVSEGDGTHDAKKRLQPTKETPPPEISPAVPAPATDTDSKVNDNTGTPASTVEDACHALGLKPGDRIEVQWDVFEEIDDNDEKAPTKTDAGTADTTPPNNKDEEEGTKIKSRWWGATLLPPSTETKLHTIQPEDDMGVKGEPVSFPIRTLDYDPYPEFGFHERSLEEACFFDEHTLFLNLTAEGGEGQSSYWRREGEQWEPPSEEEDDDETTSLETATASAEEIQIIQSILANVASATTTEERFRSLLDGVLQKVMLNVGAEEKMKRLTPAMQRVVAHKIATAKERFLEKMVDHGGEYTGDEINRMMAEAVSGGGS